MKTTQYWSDIDYCDECDNPIKKGGDVYIYTENDETDIISTRCPECLGKLEELMLGYEALGRRMKVTYLLLNVGMLAMIYAFPTFRSSLIMLIIWFNGVLLGSYLMEPYTTPMPRWRALATQSVYAGCVTLICLYNVLGNNVLPLAAIPFGYALISWRYRKTPFEMLLDYIVEKRFEEVKD